MSFLSKLISATDVHNSKLCSPQMRTTKCYFLGLVFTFSDCLSHSFSHFEKKSKFELFVEIKVVEPAEFNSNVWTEYSNMKRLHSLIELKCSDFCRVKWICYVLSDWDCQRRKHPSFTKIHFVSFGTQTTIVPSMSFFWNNLNVNLLVLSFTQHTAFTRMQLFQCN